MAKKKGSRRQSARGSSEDGSEFDDSASSLSMGGRSIAESAVVAEEAFSPFEQCIDQLYEKRATRREQALAELAGLLANSFCPEEAESRQETLARLCLSSLRRGGAVEAGAAVRAIGLLGLTLGPGGDADRLLADALPALSLATSSHKSDAVRCAAVEASALLLFTLCDDPFASQEAMAALAELWIKGGSSAPLKAASLRGWALLLSGLARPGAAQAALPSLARQLAAGDAEVRVAAGEAAGVLAECVGGAQMLAGEEEEEEAEGSAEEEAVSRSGNGADTTGEHWQHVEEQVSQLASSRPQNTRWSKADRAALKGAMRSFGQAGGGGVMKVTLRWGDTVTVEGAAGQLQLAAVRRFLAEGFQAHMQENPLLHQIFRFQPRLGRPDKLSPAEKQARRALTSADAKSRNQQRGFARAQMAAYKGAMLAGDY